MAMPVAVFIGVCGAMIGMVLTDQRLPRRAVSIGLVVAHRPGDRRSDGQRAALRGAAERHGDDRTHRGSGRGQRMVDGRRPHQPADLVSDDPNWVSILGWQGGLANQRGIFTDHLERVGPGPLPLDPARCRCRARGRRCCAFTTATPSRPCRSICPAIRHRRAEVPARSVDDAAVRLRDHHPAARTQPGHPAGAVADRLPGGARLHADPHRGPDVGCGPDQQRPSPPGARPNSSRQRRHDGTAGRRRPRRSLAAAGDSGVRAGDHRRRRRDVGRHARPSSERRRASQ